jgi:integrase
MKLPAIPSAYLRFILLTGCRPGEAAVLRWEDIDFRWCSITIRDKVEGVRTIPLTPYVAAMLLERKVANDTPPTAPVRIHRHAEAVDEFDQVWRPSPWVFPATRDRRGGHITKANKAHERALRAAGLPHVSQHGLRRSFGSLAEWVECPVGVVAQIQGHKPSATAEKHYRVRPIDLLRMWHSRIEAWMLNEAGLAIEDARKVGSLRGVKA